MDALPLKRDTAFPPGYDISSAPRDGTKILVLVDGEWRITRWSQPYLNGAPNEQYPATWEPHYGDGVFWSKPTRWAPLPG